MLPEKGNFCAGGRWVQVCLLSYPYRSFKVVCRGQGFGQDFTVEASKAENEVMIAKAGAGVRAMRFLSNAKDRAPGSHQPAGGSNGLVQRGPLASWDGRGVAQELCGALERTKTCAVKMSQQKHAIKRIAFL